MRFIPLARVSQESQLISRACLANYTAECLLFDEARKRESRLRLAHWTAVIGFVVISII